MKLFLSALIMFFLLLGRRDFTCLYSTQGPDNLTYLILLNDDHRDINFTCLVRNPKLIINSEICMGMNKYIVILTPEETLMETPKTTVINGRSCYLDIITYLTYAEIWLKF